VIFARVHGKYAVPRGKVVEESAEMEIFGISAVETAREVTSEGVIWAESGAISPVTEEYA
jgi:hypothetical protein